MASKARVAADFEPQETILESQTEERQRAWQLESEKWPGGIRYIRMPSPRCQQQAGPESPMRAITPQQAQKDIERLLLEGWTLGNYRKVAAPAAGRMED